MRRRVGLAAGATLAVLGIGTVGYTLLGFGVLDALYQTVTTVTTVGFREVHPFGTAGKVFTIVLIVIGVGTALYSSGLLLEGVIEGHLANFVGRRRMDRRIDGLRDHVIVCGLGRVGKAVAAALAGRGVAVVVIEVDGERLEGTEHAAILGDATRDEILVRAGVERARALVATLTSDADNLFVTLSGRALGSGLFIVARCRESSTADKLLRAGADRVVNPQEIGGARMAAFVAQPHVADFVDVVMHDANVEFHLEELPLVPGSPLLGRSLAEARLRERTGALVLALRQPDGTLLMNPTPDIKLASEQVLIAIGTAAQLQMVRKIASQVTER